MQRRHLIQWGAAALAASSLGAQAQSFPAKPIKLVIAFPAGGPTDITMRVLADNAGKILGQPVVVENKPGAGGTLPAVVKRLHDAFKQAMEQENYRTALARYDMVPIYMSSATYQKFAAETFEREKALVEKLGLAKPQ